ncbi:MAG: KH domain-containing protein [Candidatus Gracilibacteria bacterium]|nr:KH domain-containing protein [Candidatus Gracilibacteria bacterium]MDD3119922.1 KH domain-containing protein [Candidatus Gracilibacteria bacterium]MDD4530020.1 KH domain-containing protein [Candidatus Gracilibacteria bacterium]
MTYSDFLKFLIAGLVKNPEAIEITETEDTLGVLLTLKIAKDDMGNVIGKEGKTVNALRTILRVVGSKDNKRLNLKIEE